MSVLLGPDGRPISAVPAFRKADPPKTGEKFGDWAGRDLQFSQLPGGGVVQFDLSKLTLADYRSMRDHYQVNASLAVLSFMQHQSDWHIECSDKRIQTASETMLREIWTSLNHAMSTANWAGYSPNIIQWDNNKQRSTLEIDKVKDMVPEECAVNWKLVEGYAPPGPPGRVKPKFKIYDGIKIQGQSWPVPVDNTFWYPLLMENGNHYGRKLLRPAFTSWFFSILVHLFANRYYERFGEPVPIGRAPFDDEVTVAGTQVQGNQYMLEMLQQLRSRSVVVLPADRQQLSNGQQGDYDYDMEYLESQMRGADFERYLTRLDEEISIGLFTPILLLRTADVGSYNLGVGHMQMYLWMLNAMNDDRKRYIDKYLLRRFVDFNFSENAPDAKIVYRKMGNSNIEMLKEILTTLASAGKVGFDLKELGVMAGMSLHEVEQTVEPTPAPAESDAGGDVADGGPPPATSSSSLQRVGSDSYAVATEILNRVRPQVENAFRDGRLRDMKLTLGYKNKLETALHAEGAITPTVQTNLLYAHMDSWVADVCGLGEGSFGGPEEFMQLFERVLIHEFDALEVRS